MLKKLAFGGVGLLLLSSPLLASAQISDDYAADNQDSYCPQLSITMQRGARDATTRGQVSELQKFISDYYDIDPEEIVTGFFGRITQSYVIKFQREQGLPAYGIAGSLTRAVISRVCGNSSIDTRAHARDAHRIADVKQLQLALELYYDSNNGYPPSIEGTYLVAFGYISSIPKDPLDGSWYAYDQLGGGRGYELGASLETQSSALGSDNDVAQSGGNLWTGSDSTGCRGEANRHCYDVGEVLTSSNQASATIDQSSLTTIQGNPTVTGSAYNTNTVTVSLASASDGKVWGSGMVTVVNGRWSARPTGIPGGLTLGAYIVRVYDSNNNLLTTETLTIVDGNVSAIVITSPAIVFVKRNTLLTWTWSSGQSLNPTSNVDIYLLKDGTTQMTFATAYQNVGSFTWTAGYSYSGNQDIANGNYTIVTCPSGQVISSPQCGRFNANIYGNIPVINMAYPAGGETFQIGSAITVSFSGPQAGDQYKIDLFQPAIGTDIVYNLGTVTGQATDSSRNSLTIPYNVPAGTYQVRVIQLTNQGTSCVNVCAMAESNHFTVAVQ